MCLKWIYCYTIQSLIPITSPIYFIQIHMHKKKPKFPPNTIYPDVMPNFPSNTHCQFNPIPISPNICMPISSFKPKNLSSNNYPLMNKKWPFFTSSWTELRDAWISHDEVEIEVAERKSKACEFSKSSPLPPAWFPLLFSLSQLKFQKGTEGSKNASYEVLYGSKKKSSPLWVQHCLIGLRIISELSQNHHVSCFKTLGCLQFGLFTSPCNKILYLVFGIISNLIE